MYSLRLKVASYRASECSVWREYLGKRQMRAKSLRDDALLLLFLLLLRRCGLCIGGWNFARVGGCSRSSGNSRGCGVALRPIQSTMLTFAATSRGILGKVGGVFQCVEALRCDLRDRIGRICLGRSRCREFSLGPIGEAVAGVDGAKVQVGSAKCALGSSAVFPVVGRISGSS